jgi:hypothetical protein
MTRCRLGTDLSGARTRGYRQLLYGVPRRSRHEFVPGAPGAREVHGMAGGTRLHPLAFDYELNEQTVLMKE